MGKRKLMGILGILMGLMLMGSMLASPAAAGGRQGAGNGNSGTSNDFPVCHQKGNGTSFTLWLGDADSQQDHIDHGDSLGPC